MLLPSPTTFTGHIDGPLPDHLLSLGLRTAFGANTDPDILVMTGPPNELLKRLTAKRISSDVPIICGLTEESEATPSDSARLFRAGSDGVVILTRVSAQELAARLVAVLMRTERGKGIKHDHPVHVDRLDRLVGNQNSVKLTAKEADLMKIFLCLRLGTTFTKERIMQALYQGTDEPTQKIIDVFVCKLRKKLTAVSSELAIKTIWGKGYILVKTDAGSVAA